MIICGLFLASVTSLMMIIDVHQNVSFGELDSERYQRKSGLSTGRQEKDLDRETSNKSPVNVGNVSTSVGKESDRRHVNSNSSRNGTR